MKDPAAKEPINIKYEAEVLSRNIAPRSDFITKKLKIKILL
jgi:hypothetical protein